MPPQTEIDIAFTAISRFLIMELERGRSPFGLAFRGENDTMYTETKFLAEHQPVLFSVLECSRDHLIFEAHECKPAKTRLLRERVHEAIRQWPRVADRTTRA